MLVLVTKSLHLELDYIMGSILHILKIGLLNCVEPSKNVADKLVFQEVCRTVIFLEEGTSTSSQLPEPLLQKQAGVL